MMTKEYIEREAALDAITHNTLIDPTESDIVALTLAVAQKNIRKVPAADVVEVVRCRDCQHYIDGKCYVSNRKRIFTYDVNIHHRKADDFCSYGERRTEE